jgi:anti-sigma regulatory factor (Ser/Thr protein kinase)
MDLLIRLEPQSRQLRHIRRIIDAWLDSHGLQVETVELITTELLTNAFAATPPGARVEVELRRAPAMVEITVTDRGPGFDAERTSEADGDEDHGRGLMIVRKLADQLLIRRDDSTTRITASIATPATAEAADGTAPVSAFDDRAASAPLDRAADQRGTGCGPDQDAGRGRPADRRAVGAVPAPVDRA